MRQSNKKLIFTGSLFVALLAFARGGEVREIEIKSDPPGSGKQIFTVRFVPDENLVYSQIVFENTLRQELVLTAPNGEQVKKIFESGKFTARQRDVKMTKGVDCYVSFFVQLGAQRSCDMDGDFKIKTNAPVAVARMRITAYRKEKAAWTVDTDAGGKYKLGKDVFADAPGTNAVVKIKE